MKVKKVKKVLHRERDIGDLFLTLAELLKQPLDPDFKPWTTEYPEENYDDKKKDVGNAEGGK